MNILRIIILVTIWIGMFKGIDWLIDANLNLAFANAIMHFIAAIATALILLTLWALNELIASRIKPLISRKNQSE